MAITSRTDLVDTLRIVRTVIWENLDRNISLFNAQSRGSIQLVAGPALYGSVNNITFLKRIQGNLVRVRDIDSTAPLEEVKMEEDKRGIVKVDRTTPALAVMLDAFTREGRGGDMAVWMQQFASQVAEMTLNDQVETAVTALTACLTKLSPTGQTWVYDITGNADPLLSRYVEDISRLERFGDMANQLVCWIKRASAVQQTHESLVTDGAGTDLAVQVLRGAGVDRHGMSVFTGDLPSLIHQVGVPDQINSLALKPGAIKVILNAVPEVYVDDKPLTENPLTYLRMLWRFDLDVAGFGWNEGTGGVSPDNATLAAGANWEHSNELDKNASGYVVRHNDGYRARAT